MNSVGDRPASEDMLALRDLASRNAGMRWLAVVEMCRRYWCELAVQQAEDILITWPKWLPWRA